MARAAYAVMGLIGAWALAFGTPWGSASTAVDRRTRDEPGSILAWFDDRSYAPGEVAQLHFWRGSPPRVRLTVLRVGPASMLPSGRDEMSGLPVRGVRPLVVSTTRAWRLRIGRWPSGLYAVRLTASGGRAGFAPLIVTAPASARGRVLVVLPTNTWQAYNVRDADRDGVGDTWYADPRIPSVELARPYMQRGVPPYQPGFMRWLARMRPRPDVWSDDDLDRVRDGDRLTATYDLVVFAGHEEYVTAHVYDLVTRYRDLGGNIAFLSSNSFFYRVERRGARLFRTGKWANLGRVDARLTGVHYVGWNEARYASRPYRAANVRRATWFFAGSGLQDGDVFGSAYGVEIDQISAYSPPGTVVLARIPDLFGPGRSATMTYYETARGAKVFAAGAMNFNQPQSHVAWTLLTNLWKRMIVP